MGGRNSRRRPRRQIISASSPVCLSGDLRNGNRPHRLAGHDQSLCNRQTLRPLTSPQRELPMKSLPIVTMMIVGMATACSVNHETVQRPTPPPPTVATGPAAPQPAIIGSTQPTSTTTMTTDPGAPGPIVVNDFDPPQRVR